MPTPNSHVIEMFQGMSLISTFFFRNDELNIRLRQDIEKLNRLVMHRGSPLNLMRRDSTDGATNTDLKVRALLVSFDLQYEIQGKNFFTIFK